MHSKAGELLGYPPDARLLIVNCDDFGMDEGINAGVIDAIEHGIATSCSLMPNCPAAAQALRMLRDRPEIRCGIHLTLVRDTPGDRWAPLSARHQVRSLLDEAGELFVADRQGRAALLGQARLAEVEREFRAQIELVLAAGISPTHLDFHCLADGGRADILDLTTALALEYGLATRVWLEPGRRLARERGLPVVDNDFLDSFSLDLDDKPAQYARLLTALPAGLSEWAVHPSSSRVPARPADTGWRVRRTDYEFLTSAAAGELLRGQRIQLIDYTAIQQVWCDR